jgi:hypothetical protein
MKSDLFDLLTNARKETILNDNEERSKILLLRRMGRAEEDFLFCTPGRGIDGECLFHRFSRRFIFSIKGALI